MNPSICIDAIFFGTATPLREQVRIIKEAGFSTIEFWTWWDKDLSELKSACNEYGVKIHCMCTRFISLVDLTQKQAYLTGLEESLKVAKDLGCPNLITQVGNRMEGVDESVQAAQAVETLKLAGDMVAKAGLTLLVEPLNIRVDHAGYFLDTTDRAVALLERVNHPGVKLLFDIYHQQITEGDVLRHIEQSAHLIGHLHAADNPGRDRPGTGEIQYAFLLEKLDAMFKDTVCLGLEYFPKEPISESLSKMALLLKGDAL